MKKLPLSGIRVLDLSRVVAAPTGVQILADLGADVIKVERPVTGDDGRNFGVWPFKGPDGKPTRDGSMFMSANRNKRGITIDISTPAGQDLVKKLAAKSDVLFENYKTGDLARYGLDHDAIKAINPRIVYVSVTGFGHTGPDRFKPGYDPIFQGRGGWMSINGETDDNPTIAGSNAVDMIAGYFAAMSALAALYHRDRVDDPAGKGQAADIALLDSALAAMSLRGMDYLLTGQQPARRENLGTVLPCKDGSVVIAAASPKNWESLCTILGHPEWGTDPRYCTHAARLQTKYEIYPKINEASRTRGMVELSEKLDAAGVPVAPVYNFEQAFNDPQVIERGMKVRVRHGSGNDMDMIASPIKLSDTPITEYRAPPQLGQHTDEVLKEVLGLDAEAIAALRKSKTI